MIPVLWWYNGEGHGRVLQNLTDEYCFNLDGGNGVSHHWLILGLPHYCEYMAQVAEPWRDRYDNLGPGYGLYDGSG